MIDIVVLDGKCLNPGDLDWRPLQSLGKVAIYDRTPQNLIVERMGSAEIMITNKCTITSEIIDALPKLKYIGALATGYNNIDCDYAAKSGIVVTNIPAYSTESVVQTTFGLIIEVYSKLSYHAKRVKEGDWVNASDFCFYDTGHRELQGKTLGIVGFGGIGKRVGEIARAFGMKVLVYNNGKSYPEAESTKSLKELLERSDIVTLHCPLTAQNAKMINKEILSYMKKGGVLINTARGGLIDEEALAEALNSSYLSGAGLDVLGTEPPTADNPLLSAKNAFITPHIAWATREARGRLMDIAVENVREFLQGNVINRVN